MVGRIRPDPRKLVTVTVPKEINASPEALERIQECEDFLNFQVPDEKLRLRLVNTLKISLKSIVGLGRAYKLTPTLHRDSAPLSFGFSAGLQGGLIWSGSGSAYPTLSVNVDPSFVGWSLHT